MNSYLRQDVVAEPLINRWYATAYLVSPMTAPLMVANGHLPTLRSFASAPMVHVNALKNPEMQGGAYIAYGPERVAEIRSLIAERQQMQVPLASQCAGMIARLKQNHVLINAMGGEPWLSYITPLDYSGESKPILEAGRLVDHCRQRGLAVEDLFCKKEMHFEGMSQ
jgi:hypothetical protein